MFESPWVKIQTAKTLSDPSPVWAPFDTDPQRRRTRRIHLLLKFWQRLPDEFFSTRTVADEPISVLELTSYIPQQPPGHCVAYIRLAGYDGLAVLGSDGMVETIPNPIGHPLLEDLHRFDAGLQAQHLCPRLLELEANTKPTEVP